MRYLLHPFQLAIAAISAMLTPSSITLIMVSDPEDDHPVYAAGWIGILAVAVLVVILVTGVSRRDRRELGDELLDALRELARLEARQTNADLRQITIPGRGDTGPQRTHHLN